MKNKTRKILLTAMTILLGSMIFSACGESRTPSAKKALSAPDNLYLSIHEGEQTEYILIWDPVENAVEYEVNVGPYSRTVKTAECNVSPLTKEGKEYEMSVAAKNGSEYANSGKTTIIAKTYVISEELSYTPQGNEYAVTGEGKTDFSDCLAIPDFYEGKPVTEISASAFAVNVGVQAVRIPKTIKTIGANAFTGCKNLLRLDCFCDTIEIGQNAFSDTAWYDEQKDGYVFFGTALYKYKGDMPSGTVISQIPAQAKSVVAGAFSGQKNLASITLPDQWAKLPPSLFDSCTSLETVTFSSKTKEIGASAFHGCQALQRVELPYGLETIGRNAFSFCSSLVEVSVPNSVVSIGNGAFQNCISLSEPVFPTKIEQIAPSAYQGCSSLTSVEIPEHIVSVSDYAFADCARLAKITLSLNGKLASIGRGAFFGSAAEEIFIPSTVKSIGYGALAGAKMKKIEVAPSNENFLSANGNLYSKDGKTFIQYAGGREETKFVMSNTVTTVYPGAFTDCSFLKELIFSENIERMVASYVDGYPFLASCPELEIVTLPKKLVYVSYFVRDCPKLLSLEIPNECEAAARGTFGSGCLVCAIILPEGLKELAPLGADGYEQIYYKGTQAQWILIDGNRLIPSRSTVYYYSETEPTGEGNYWHYDENGNPEIWE